jgi:hypothetical protein
MKKLPTFAAIICLSFLVAAVCGRRIGEGDSVVSDADRRTLRDSVSGEFNTDLPPVIDPAERKRLETLKAASGPQGSASPSSGGCTPKAYAPDPDSNAPLPPLDVASRIKGRKFPSAFQAWFPAQRLDPTPFANPTALPDDDATIARHDLAFLWPWSLGMKYNNACSSLATGFTPASIAAGLGHRAAILAANPNAVLLLSIFYFETNPNALPEDSPLWLRDSSGHRIPDPYGYNSYLLDFASEQSPVRRQVASLCRAAVQSGVFDGCMFDNWAGDDDGRVKLVQAVRAAIGEDALIMVNANNRRLGRTAPYVNGVYMEGFNSSFWKSDEAGWKLALGNLQWASQSLRAPAFAALEGWYSRSRDDLNDVQLMRAVTALALTQSAYVLFGDPNHTAKFDHLHDWYPFWDKGLGRPTGEAVDNPDGSITREFAGGTVVFNPPWNKNWATVKFADGDRTSRATHLRAAQHRVQPGDGDIFLK